MPNLDEIKARRERITQGGWVFEKQPSTHFDCPNLKHIAICGYVKREFSSNEITDFIANSPTDIDWLIAEVEGLKAEKVQAEAERDALAAELKENWPFLGGVMYAAAEMVSNGMDMTVPLEILTASGHWDEFEAHCNSCDVERFRQAVGEKCVNRLRRKPFSQQHAEKRGE